MKPLPLADLGTACLSFTRTGPIAWLTIDRAERRNSLTMAMYRGIGRALDVVESTLGLEVLVITGVDDVFIVGGDMSDHDSTEEPDDAELPFTRLLDGSVPVVAAINGHCQASGVTISVLADVSVASDRSRFRLPELRLGVAAPWSAAILPSVIGFSRAKELALTGRSIDADEALRIGLVGRVVSHLDLMEQARLAAFELMEVGPMTRMTWKRAVHAHLPRFTDAETDGSFRTAEATEGFAAFLAGRPPSWSPRA